MRTREATVEDVEALFDIRCSVEQNAMSREELARFGITPASVAEMITGGDTVTSLVEEEISRRASSRCCHTEGVA